MESETERLLTAARAMRESGRRAVLALYRDAESAARDAGDAGDAGGVVHALRHVADLQLELGDPASARETAGEAVATAMQVGVSALDHANCLRLAALAADGCGDRASARVLWSEAEELYRTAGVADGVAECRVRRG